VESQSDDELDGVTSVAESVEMDCRTVKAKRDSGEKFLFLDCREPSEHDVAKIDGTTLIPMSQLPDRVSEIEEFKNQSIVVHCHHGGRSLRVVNWLRKEGFLKAMNLTGGIDQWSIEIDSTIPRY